jgi:hypothetical protein
MVSAWLDAQEIDNRAQDGIRRTDVCGAVVLLMAIYYYFNIPNYVIWQKEGNYQTHIAESVADTIIKAGTQSPFYLVSVPFANTNDHIRYYLELKGHTPLPDDTTEMAQDLVILCYDKGPKGCDVMNEPQYLVVHFGDRAKYC